MRASEAGIEDETPNSRVKSGYRAKPEMAKREPRMVSLGYGKFARADRIYALVPMDPKDRGDGRRTYVHVDDMAEPIVASRSERAILADMEAALTEAAGIPRRRRGGAKGQEKLL
jgi:hypothetical protein